MIKIDHCFMLNVMNLGAIVDVMLAILPSLCDRIVVLFARRRNDLDFYPDSKDAFHLPQIYEQISNRIHASVVYWVVFNDQHLATILLKFCEFVQQIFTTFGVADCLGGGDLLKVTIHDQER
jgi:hypothetical protein